MGEGKAAKGDYSKYRKPPPGIERSGTPRPGAPLVWQKVTPFSLLRAGVWGKKGVPLSALGFEGSGAALAARGVRLPADAVCVCGGVAESKERDGRTALREAPLGIYSAAVEWGWRLWGGGGWLRLGGWGMFGGG